METNEIILMVLGVLLAISEGMGSSQKFKNNSVLGLVKELVPKIVEVFKKKK